MGSYAFRPRRRSPNTLLCFGIVMEKYFPENCIWLRVGITWASESTKTRKNDAAENKYFGDYAKCLTGGYEYLQGITGCEATPAPKSFFGRKTEGRELKNTTFRTSL